MPPVTKTTTTNTAPSSNLNTLDKPSRTMPLKREERPVKYPKYDSRIYSKPDERGNEYLGPLTGAIAKKILGWESEKDYTARMLATNPGSKEGKWKFGDDYILLLNEEKIKCWNNPITGNRPFDEKHAREICQDILTRNYKMNLENIILSLTGFVLSGQHRLIGLILAIEEWMKCKVKNGKGYWEEWWEEEPYIETMIAVGASEDPDVIRTYDNVKQRTLSDTIWTSPTFGDIKDLPDRRELCRYMDNAVDYLWKRTYQVIGKNSWIQHQTHSSSLEFLDRHPKIKECVKHVFNKNRHRVLSLLGLNTGQCAALMYLMGSSSSDPENYHYAGSKKTESQLTWQNYDRALGFWNIIADQESAKGELIRDALKNPMANILIGSSAPQKVKHIVLSKAWTAYVKDEDFTTEELQLTAEEAIWSDEKNRIVIKKEITVGGIDCGVIKGNGEDDDEERAPTEEEIAKQKEDDRKQRAADMKARLEERKAAEAAKKQPVGKPFSDEERAAEVEKVKAMAKPKPPAKPTLPKKS